MVTVKVESKDEMEFLQTAFKHAWKINGCDAADIRNVMEQVDTLDVTNQTLKLNESQEKAFRIVMQLYNDLSADFVTWSDNFMQQLPAVAKDAPAFYEMLRDYHLQEYAPDAFTLFIKWITLDWGYFNAELLDLLERTRNLDWFSVSHWCRRTIPSSDTQVSDESIYYRKEYCK